MNDRIFPEVKTVSKVCSKCKEKFSFDLFFEGYDLVVCDKCSVQAQELKENEMKKDIALAKFKEVVHPEYAQTDRDHPNYPLSLEKEVSERLKDNLMVLMIGSSGLGKSRVSAMIGLDFITDDKTIYWLHSHPFSDNCQIKIKYPERYLDMMDDAINCDLLIFDDFGAVQSTETVISALTFLLESRINQQKASILSSNETKDEMIVNAKEKARERILDRLWGNAKVLNIK